MADQERKGKKKGREERRDKLIGFGEATRALL